MLMLSLKVEYRLAVLGALAFGFSTYLIIIIGAGHNAKAHAISYMPFVLGSIIYVVRKKYLLGFFLTTLFLGLQLITSPLRYVIEEAPHILDFPILNLFKWILVFMSDTILFFWDTFSIFGSLILTAIVTFIVFSLVNYPITLGITFATYFIITLIFLKKNK